ncbi:reverse transcriptase domain-containing protein, partial [Tanacetum coccineum]
IDLHNDQLDDLALSRIDEYERDVSRLNTKTGNMVRDLTTIKDRVYELQGDSMMARDAHQSIWQRLSTLELQNVALQRLHHEDCMEIQSLKRHVADLERAEKERRRREPLAAASTTDANTSKPIGNNNQGGTYKEFRSCMTGGFNGIEGAVGLSRWLEKLETVFRICNCEDEARVKYASFTLQDAALTWWNNHLKSAGIDTTYAMPWEHFKEMVLRKYCPRNEVQKLESEFWNLKVKGTNLTVYNQRY